MGGHRFLYRNFFVLGVGSIILSRMAQLNAITEAHKRLKGVVQIIGEGQYPAYIKQQSDVYDWFVKVLTLAIDLHKTYCCTEQCNLCGSGTCWDRGSNGTKGPR